MADTLKGFEVIFGAVMHRKIYCSPSLSGGNLVDGLLRAQRIEAVGVPHGGAGPGTMCKMIFSKFEN